MRILVGARRGRLSCFEACEHLEKDAGLRDRLSAEELKAEQLAYMYEGDTTGQLGDGTWQIEKLIKKRRTAVVGDLAFKILNAAASTPSSASCMRKRLFAPPLSGSVAERLKSKQATHALSSFRSPRRSRTSLLRSARRLATVA